MNSNTIRTKYTRVWSRDYSSQYCEACLRALSEEVKNHIPIRVTDIFFIPENKNESLFASTLQWDSLLEKLEEINNTHKLLNETAHLFNLYGKKYVKISKTIGRKNFTACSNDDLYVFYKQYLRIYYIYTAHIWATLLLNDIFAEKGKKFLASKQLTNLDIHLVSALFSPSKIVGVLKLQNLLSTYKKKGIKKLPKKFRQQLLKKYPWVPCLDLQNSPWTETNIDNFYNSITVVQKSTNWAQAKKQLKLTGPEIVLFKSIKLLAYIKDMRDVYRRQGTFYIRPLFLEIDKRLKLSRNSAAYLLSEEIKLGLSHKLQIPRTQIYKRKLGFSMFWQNQRIVISTLPTDKQRFKTLLPLAPISKIIKGVVAMNGKAVGIVKIVKTVSDLKKVQKGNILVAITTHPDFLPAMHKAAAFITDEGGLTSHAAIVAREMKKPCITGTKNVTKILKDGDLVEVNANRGIVKKL